HAEPRRPRSRTGRMVRPAPRLAAGRAVRPAQRAARSGGQPVRGLSDAALCLSAHSFRRAARRCFAVALVVLSAIATGCLPGPVRVMSYNIRFASSDGPDRWELRRDGVLERIRAFEPDVLGLQEVLSSQAEFLISELPDYTFVGVGRDDGHKAGEMVPILFRNRTFTLVGH